MKIHAATTKKGGGLAPLFHGWWSGIKELERRATSIVQALDDATLEAIAAGMLDMRAMCRQVADEIHQTA